MKVTPNPKASPVPLLVVKHWEEVRPDGTEEPGIPGVALRANHNLIVVACPGCGRVSGMAVYGPGEPKQESPSWELTHPINEPDKWTLSPSVNCVGCCGWHGWLKEGTFQI